IHTPGEQGGEVELQVFDSDGQATIETPGVFTVEEETVTVVDIEGLEPGTYSVVVRTEAPSFAAVRSTADGQQNDEAQDLSWTAAAEPVQPGFGALLPPAAETEDHLLGEGELPYRLMDSAGATSEDLTVEVAPDRSATVPHSQLQDQAEAEGLEDIHSVLVTEAAGEVRGGLISRDQEGRF